MGGGSETPDRVARGLPTGGQGSKVSVLCAEPKEHKHFRPGARPGGSGTRPGGSVTGVIVTVFMCQMFRCLFRPLENTRGGVEKGGGGKTSRRTALPKRPPLLLVRFPHPLSGHCSVFFLQLSRQEALLEELRSFSGGCILIRFPPHTFCILPYHCLMNYFRLECAKLAKSLRKLLFEGVTA